jgi:hypothetical protein
MQKFCCQLGKKIDVCGKYSLLTLIKSYFCSAIYNSKCTYLRFKKYTHLQLTSVQWSLFRFWQLKK